jgi:hypothetical protein
MPERIWSSRLALRVGVSGHRDLRKYVPARLQIRLRTILKEIADAVAVVARDAGPYYSGGPPLLRVVSPLAEGADRLVAAEALSLGWDLQCPLPFHRDEYKKDFSGKASADEFDKLLGKAIAILELDGDRAPESSPYETVGRVVLDHCDILIAMWDGKPERGAGGTARIVAMAQTRGTPVFWMNVLTGEERLLREEWDGEDRFLSPKTIREIVGRLLLPPWLKEQREKVKYETGEYVVSMKTGKTILGSIWTAFRWVMSIGAKIPHFEEYVDKEIPDPFRSHYEAVNERAKRMAGLDRGAFLVCYTLGVCAVVLALLNSVLGSFGWLIGELAAITVVFGLVMLLRHNHWHDRSVECRYLAEQFRILRYVYPLGLTSPRPHMPAHNRHADVSGSWMDWHLRAVLRRTPMPSFVVSPEYLDRHWRLLRREWVVGQIVYHERNHLRLGAIDDALHAFLWATAALAAGACVLHLLPIHDMQIRPWLTLFAAGLPAAASGFHAISTQGEFRRLSERSEAMRASLEKFDKRLEKHEKRGQLAMRNLRRFAAGVAQDMLAEVVDWHVLNITGPPVYP